MRSVKKYSDEFKTDAVKLSKEQGVPKAAKSLGVAPSTLHGWCLKASFTEGAVKAEGLVESKTSYEDLVKKFRQLEKEHRYMLEINKVLKKSLGIMGQESLEALKK